MISYDNIWMKTVNLSFPLKINLVVFFKKKRRVDDHLINATNLESSPKG